MKDDVAIVKRLKSGETVPTGAVPADFVRTAAGELHVSTPSGPQEMVHAANINTVLSAAGGAGWEKVQATTSNYVITRPTSGAGLDLHIEAGTLAALTAANWPVPATGVDQLRIRNFSGAAKTLTAGAGWNIVTADGNPLTSGSYSIPDDRAVEVTLDPNGFAQVVPWGGEVTQAEFTSGLASKAATTHAHTKADIGLGLADNTAAITGGLTVGQVYMTSTGQLMVRY